MAIVICKLDLGKMVTENGGNSNVIKVPTMEVLVEIPSDKKVEKAIGENPLLQQQMVDACKKMFKHAATMLAKEVKLYETLANNGEPVQDKWKGNCENVRKMLITNSTKECQAVWDRLLKTKAEYKSYKIVTGVKLGLNALSVGAGIGTTIVAGWTGAGTIVGIVGIVRGLSTLGQKLYELSKEAEGIQEELEKTLGEVIKFYKEKTRRPSGPSRSSRPPGAS